MSLKELFNLTYSNKLLASIGQISSIFELYLKKEAKISTFISDLKFLFVFFERWILAKWAKYVQTSTFIKLCTKRQSASLRIYKTMCNFLDSASSNKFQPILYHSTIMFFFLLHSVIQQLQSTFHSTQLMLMTYRKYI